MNAMGQNPFEIKEAESTKTPLFIIKRQFKIEGKKKIELTSNNICFRNWHCGLGPCEISVYTQFFGVLVKYEKYKIYYLP